MEVGEHLEFFQPKAPRIGFAVLFSFVHLYLHVKFLLTKDHMGKQKFESTDIYT